MKLYVIIGAGMLLLLAPPQLLGQAIPRTLQVRDRDSAEAYLKLVGSTDWTDDLHVVFPPGMYKASDASFITAPFRPENAQSVVERTRELIRNFLKLRIPNAAEVKREKLKDQRFNERDDTIRAVLAVTPRFSRENGELVSTVEFRLFRLGFKLGADKRVTLTAELLFQDRATGRMRLDPNLSDLDLVHRALVSGPLRRLATSFLRNDAARHACENVTVKVPSGAVFGRPTKS